VTSAQTAPAQAAGLEEEQGPRERSGGLADDVGKRTGRGRAAARRCSSPSPDDKYVQTVNGEVVEKGSFKLDETKKPFALDILVAEGTDAGQKAARHHRDGPDGQNDEGGARQPGARFGRQRSRGRRVEILVFAKK
jgi:hypothetical protein